jgi:molybdopterin/thiamine biosynthesis adenylyltransferase
MRDEQVRRYSRHIMLPDVGGLGQTALMVASAKVVLRETEPAAELVAAEYLAAGGVGSLVMPSASDAQRAELTARAADTKVVTNGDGREVVLAPRPAWWPNAHGDAAALAFWRGGIAATLWMADVANK